MKKARVGYSGKRVVSMDGVRALTWYRDVLGCRANIRQVGIYGYATASREGFIIQVIDIPRTQQLDPAGSDLRRRHLAVQRGERISVPVENIEVLRAEISGKGQSCPPISVDEDGVKRFSLLDPDENHLEFHEP